jgi:DNA-directed RNA polymerase subunit RPC12/RpoP
MNTQCAKCGAPVEAVWGFCPKCGAAAAHERERTPAPQKHERFPVKGTFGGLLLGVIFAPVLLIAGTMLCLTGLGAFLGVPMIILGILAPLIGPTLGINAVSGLCPWCGAKVGSIGPIDSFVCWSCQNKIQVKHRELLRAN